MPIATLCLGSSTCQISQLALKTQGGGARSEELLPASMGTSGDSELWHVTLRCQTVHRTLGEGLLGLKEDVSDSQLFPNTEDLSPRTFFPGRKRAGAVPAFCCVYLSTSSQHEVDVNLTQSRNCAGLMGGLRGHDS